MNGNFRRYTLGQLRKLKGLSNAKKFNRQTDADVDRMIAEDPDLYQLTEVELAEFDLAQKRDRQSGD